MRGRENLERIGDARLVKRIEEFLSTKNALEIELAAMLSEYAKRRIAFVRAGKEVAGPLAEPLALSHDVRTSMARREAVAAQNAQSDADAMRDPRTRQLLTS
jgi:hypothetical protein